ncbi:MAG: hypothetical protein ACTHLP_16915 [Rhizobiaceae bacterium]|jgi:hypothetical protein
MNENLILFSTRRQNRLAGGCYIAGADLAIVDYFAGANPVSLYDCSSAEYGTI